MRESKKSEGGAFKAPPPPPGSYRVNRLVSMSQVYVFSNFSQEVRILFDTTVYHEHKYNAHTNK